MTRRDLAMHLKKEKMGVFCIFPEIVTPIATISIDIGIRALLLQTDNT